ncbi:MAG TPA: hypothetical protein VGV14_00885 [Rhodanobacter sp.]|nr:hypothetical protein [Rhodanobacter sp.]
MAALFDSNERIVPTWLAVARHLQATGGTGRNLVLEIPRPGTLTRSDQKILQLVDSRIVTQGTGLSIDTIAGTIFPQGLYARRGRPDFYPEYLRLLGRAKKGGTWGQYFDRMIRRRTPDGTEINPLEVLIEKLKRAATTGGSVYQSTYELSPSDPTQDIDPVDEAGAELATYDPGQDRNRPYGGPCLSHLSFKITDRHILDLTAIYRSHRYCERALGNLVGLARLQKYVAAHSTLDLGTLTCVSTHAELDLSNWGGAVKGRVFLDSL